MKSKTSKRLILKRSVKRPFLLLEVLISLALVLMVLGPLIAPLYNIRRAENARTAAIIMERNARILMARLKAEDLYVNRIPWDLLKEGCEGTLPDELYVVKYELLSVAACDKKSAQTEYLVLDCILTLKEKKSAKEGTFCFSLLLERKVNA